MAERRRRRQQPDANILTRTVAEELLERLGVVNRRFEHVLLIAAEPQYISERLRESGQVTDVVCKTPSPGGVR